MLPFFYFYIFKNNESSKLEYKGFSATNNFVALSNVTKWIDTDKAKTLFLYNVTTRTPVYKLNHYEEEDLFSIAEIVYCYVFDLKELGIFPEETYNKIYNSRH